MLAITGMSAIGAGVARLASGKVIFTPFTIAGERVLVRVTKDRRDYAEGELVRVVEPSPARVDPRCEHFGECGGCQYQHMSMEEQARVKDALVVEQVRLDAGSDCRREALTGRPATGACSLAGPTPCAVSCGRLLPLATTGTRTGPS